MTNDLQAVSYCVGLSLATSLKEQQLDSLNPTLIAEAINDIFGNKNPKFSAQEANQIIQEFVQSQSEKQFGNNKEIATLFLTENKTKEGVFVTESGLQYEVITEGTGNTPTATDTVEVHYHGTLINGTVFDSSIDRGQTTTFGVNQVIKGWTEALQLMKEGSTYRLYIPQDLAYGANPHPGGAIEPFMALIFDVELISIKN
jgi:FKBP-type peptidyl-prolyl cis-trans isomerase